MPRRSEQYKDRQRDEILDAARRCFLRNGFHRTSTRDVIAETGRSAGAVYRYFPSKDDMILAIATQNLQDVARLLKAATEAGGPGAEPGAIMAAFLDQIARQHSDDHLAEVAVMVWSEALRNPELGRRLREANDFMLRELAASVRQRRTSDALDVLSPEQTAQVLLATLPGYLLTLALLDPSAPSYFPDVVRHLWPDAPLDERPSQSRPAN
ncbi:TetR/AcrR family transcriptional regulator [Leifsonia sp. AG29]|uniref:TetR/AcrR family transcriptional regulator n=1 Tax=Leifsonia sp. AG29 TaxID=2598860 RepID=UPI00131ACECA|nr:TetR/AcrR family transcriptional regulator [Leifsonia sp. AG29]